MSDWWKAAVRRVRRWIGPVGRRVLGVPSTLLEEYPDHPALFDQYRHLLATGHERVPGGWRIAGRVYPDYLTVGGCSAAIERVALGWCVGRGVDVGAGFWPLPGSIPIDSTRGPGLARGMEEFEQGSLDYVFSSHCLEHIADWNDALAKWVAKLRVGGVLFLYLPHPACMLWHMSNPFMAGQHLWVPTPEVIVGAIRRLGLAIEARDDGPDHFQSFYVCGRKLP